MHSIKGIRFGLFNEKEIRRLSVVQVTETTVYEKGLPKVNGINDHRMGCVDRKLKCGTCRHQVENCNGHFGHIELPFPIYHPGYIDVVLKILRSVCFFCSSLIWEGVSNQEVELLDEFDVIQKKKFTTVTNALKNKTIHRCPRCEGIVPNYVRTGLDIRTEWEEALIISLKISDEEQKLMKAQFTAREARTILEGISEQDIETLGFDIQHSHPKNMILFTLVVPPPIIRPTIMAVEGSKARGQDDLTHRLLEIIKVVENLNKKIELNAKNSEWLQVQQMIGLPYNQKYKIDNFDHIDVSEIEILHTIGDLQVTIAAYITGEGKSTTGSTLTTQSSFGGNTTVGSNNGHTVINKSLIHRLKGKEGRIRGNLMGKRDNFSARSVISPDPLIDLDELGIPKEIAMTLTISETVNSYNLHKLTECVRRGPNSLYGAKSIQVDKNHIIYLDMCDHYQRLRLEIGWKVERYLQDGDYVVFNRQPSLHKMSMMGHRVKIMPKGLTFRLNVCCTTPYNADFDGDEMNMHVCQSINGREEIRQLMSVPEHIVTPQSNKPIIGLIQDTLLAYYIMTQDGVMISHAQMCQFSMIRRHPNGLDLPRDPGGRDNRENGENETFSTGGTFSSLRDPGGRDNRENGENGENETFSTGGTFLNQKVWKGRQVLSLLLPQNLNWRSGDVVIESGNLISGVLIKKHLGTSHNGLIHVLYNDYSPIVAAHFISDAQRIATVFLADYGFSIGIQDCILKSDVSKNVERFVEETIQYVTQNTIKCSERKVFSTLNGVINTVGNAVQAQLIEGSADRGIRNGLCCMVQAGSKGSVINISQITSCVGQQSIDGSRIYGKNKQERTLNCYAKENDDCVESRGFVEASYLKGLNPRTFFLHAMAGREGLVDTSVKTSTTGYIQRKLVKGLETLRVEYDGTVRDASKRLIELHYGGDGFDATYLQKIELQPLEWDDQLLKTNLVIDRNDTLQEEEFQFVKTLRDYIRNSRITILTPVLEKSSYLPVHMERLLLQFDSCHEPTMPQKIAFQIIKNQIYNLFSIEHDCELLFSIATTLTSYRASFYPIEVLAKIMDTILSRIHHANISPGEMVGALAAESCGEPTTQLSVDENTLILYKDGQNRYHVQKIKDMYSFFEKSHQDQMFSVQRPDGWVSTGFKLCQNENIQIEAIACDKEVVEWHSILEMSKHPYARNKMIELGTKSGKSVRATPCHSFLVRKWDGIVDDRADNLKLGDFVPISSMRVEYEEDKINDLNILEEQRLLFFWRKGLEDALGGRLEESIAKDETMSLLYHSQHQKGDVVQHSTITLQKHSLHEIRYYLGGFMDAVGRVQWKKKCLEIVFDQENEKHKENVAQLFQFLGYILHDSNQMVRKSDIHHFLYGKWSHGGNIPIRIWSKIVDFEELYDKMKNDDDIIPGAYAWMQSKGFLFDDGFDVVQGNGRCKWGRNKKKKVVPKKAFMELKFKTEITKGELLQWISAEKQYLTPEIVDYLKLLVESNVYWDEIVSIGESQVNEEIFVYDIGVGQKIDNFSLANGMIVHNTLNTFHLAGVMSKNVTLGVPRLREILDVSKKMRTPIVTIPCENHHSLQKQILHQYFRNCVDHYDFVAPELYANGLDAVFLKHVSCKWILRFFLKDFAREIEKILEKMRKHFRCNLWIFYQFDIHAICVSIDEPPTNPFTSDVKDISIVLEAMAEQMMDEIEISGIFGVRSCDVRKVDFTTFDPKSGEMFSKSEFVLDVSVEKGSFRNLIFLPPLMSRRLKMEKARIVSNDILEVYEIFGIEAVAYVLFHEIKSVLSSDGSYVNDRHIHLIVQIMTQLGFIMPMNRHGLNRIHTTGPLAKSSFEETVDVLFDAAGFGEVDQIRGVTENIMIGQIAPIGTGFCKILPKTKTFSTRKPFSNPQPPIFSSDDDDEMVITNVAEECIGEEYQTEDLLSLQSEDLVRTENGESQRGDEVFDEFLTPIETINDENVNQIETVQGWNLENVLEYQEDQDMDIMMETHPIYYPRSPEVDNFVSSSSSRGEEYMVTTGADNCYYPRSPL